MLHAANTKHNHQGAFGRLVLGCPRCEELATGAPKREWKGMAFRKQQEARELQAIRTHDFAACAAKNVVCTHFDW